MIIPLNTRNYMAFESFDRYTDELANEYVRTGKLEYLLALTSFYSTVLEPSNRFRSQKYHAAEAIKRINPEFATGYFKPIKRTKKT
jgi:hypothetical protein